MKAVLLFIILLSQHLCTLANSRSITHEDIRNALLTMGQVLRDTTDKLERHELRERQLGEQLKKALSSLDKRERAQDHILGGINTKLNSVEERLKKIESALNQDEAAKGAYVVDTVPLQSWMSNVEGLLNKQSIPGNDLLSSKIKLDAMEAAYNSKMDYIASLIEKLQSELLKTSTKMASLFEEQREQHSIDHKKWHNSLISQVEQHTNRVANLNSYNNINNGTITEEIRAVKDDIVNIVNIGLNKMENKLTDIDYSLHSEEQNIIDIISKGREMMEDYFRQVHEKFQSFSNDINALEKIEKILIQTDDNVLDTKRKIEFMMFQVIKGVEESLSGQSKDMNDTINDGFNALSRIVIDNQNISVTNVSKKIESEMEQLWRQIGMLYTQLAESSSILGNLQNHTQIYVNQSTDKMEKMDKRIEAINIHVAEIHENVNYFMGRLSLVTQEFNQTRNALATVIDNLKIDLDKPRDDTNLGPGPIPIDPNHDPNLDNRL